MNALILVGAAASSKQFINKVKSRDPRHAARRRHDERRDRRPGRREGARRAEPLRRDHHRRRPDRARALEDARTSRTATTSTRRRPGSAIPLPNVVVKLAERQAEQHLRQRRGRVLVRDDVPATSRRGSARTSTTRTGSTTVNNFGSIQVMNTDYASLHTGKYDADDTYGLVAVRPDASSPIGDWKHLTPDRGRQRLRARPSSTGVVTRCCAGWRGRRCRGTTRRRAGCCARRRACLRAITAPASMQ